MFHGCSFGRSRGVRVVVQREGVTGRGYGVETETVKQSNRMMRANEEIGRERGRRE